LAQQAQVLRACSSVPAFNADANLTTEVGANSIDCKTGGRIQGRDFNIIHCQGPETADGGPGSNRLLLKKQGGRVLELDAKNQSPQLQAMSLYEVNLGGSMFNEYVLAIWNAQSNGMGINVWTLIVLTRDLHHLETITDVADFGPNNIVQGPNGCALAVTSFSQVNGARGRNHWVYKARFMRLRSGDMVPATNMPPRERRYNAAFERQRISGFDAQTKFPKYGDAVSWLNATR
jgi:hypothetical protein